MNIGSCVKSSEAAGRARTRRATGWPITIAPAPASRLAAVALAAGSLWVAACVMDAGGATARALRASDTAHLHYVSVKGSWLLDEGHASGTVPGTMRVHMRVAATFSGTFTIRARGGTIVGHGSAIPHGAGIYESFAGSLTVTEGSGRYTHAHGRAHLYGTFNRNSYALVVQTVGTLLY